MVEGTGEGTSMIYIFYLHHFVSHWLIITSQGIYNLGQENGTSFRVICSLITSSRFQKNILAVLGMYFTVSLNLNLILSFL